MTLPSSARSETAAGDKFDKFDEYGRLVNSARSQPTWKQMPLKRSFNLSELIGLDVLGWAEAAGRDAAIGAQAEKPLAQRNPMDLGSRGQVAAEQRRLLGHKNWARSVTARSVRALLNREEEEEEEEEDEDEEEGGAGDGSEEGEDVVLEEVHDLGDGRTSGVRFGGVTTICLLPWESDDERKVRRELRKQRKEEKREARREQKRMAKFNRRSEGAVDASEEGGSDGATSCGGTSCGGTSCGGTSCGGMSLGNDDDGGSVYSSHSFLSAGVSATGGPATGRPANGLSKSKGSSKGNSKGQKGQNGSSLHRMRVRQQLMVEARIKREELATHTLQRAVRTWRAKSTVRSLREEAVRETEAAYAQARSVEGASEEADLSWTAFEASSSRGGNLWEAAAQFEARQFDLTGASRQTLAALRHRPSSERDAMHFRKAISELRYNRVRSSQPSMDPLAAATALGEPAAAAKQVARGRPLSQLEGTVWSARAAPSAEVPAYDSNAALCRLLDQDWCAARRSHGLEFQLLLHQNGRLDRTRMHAELEAVRSTLMRYRSAIYHAFEHLATVSCRPKPRSLPLSTSSTTLATEIVEKKDPGKGAAGTAASAAAELPHLMIGSAAFFHDFVKRCHVATAHCPLDEIEQMFDFVHGIEEDEATHTVLKHAALKFETFDKTNIDTHPTGTLQRVEWVELLVRIAIRRYGGAGGAAEAAEALERLCREVLLRHLPPPEGPHQFRKSHCYVQQTAHCLELHLPVCRALFLRFAKPTLATAIAAASDRTSATSDRVIPAGDAEWVESHAMSMIAWLSLVGALGLFECDWLSIPQARDLFLQARLRTCPAVPPWTPTAASCTAATDSRVPPQLSLRSHLEFCDFLEALVRLAVALPWARIQESTDESEPFAPSAPSDALVDSGAGVSGSSPANTPTRNRRLSHELAPVAAPEPAAEEAAKHSTTWQRVDRLLRNLARAERRFAEEDVVDEDARRKQEKKIVREVFIKAAKVTALEERANRLRSKQKNTSAASGTVSARMEALERLNQELARVEMEKALETDYLRNKTELMRTSKRRSNRTSWEIDAAPPSSTSPQRNRRDSLTPPAMRGRRGSADHTNTQMVFCMPAENPRPRRNSQDSTCMPAENPRPRRNSQDSTCMPAENPRPRRNSQDSTCMPAENPRPRRNSQDSTCMPAENPRPRRNSQDSMRG